MMTIAVVAWMMTAISVMCAGVSGIVYVWTRNDVVDKLVPTFSVTGLLMLMIAVIATILTFA